MLLPTRARRTHNGAARPATALGPSAPPPAARPTNCTPPARVTTTAAVGVPPDLVWMNTPPVAGVNFVAESKCTLRTWLMTVPYLALVIFTLFSDTLATGASGRPHITLQ